MSKKADDKPTSMPVGPAALFWKKSAYEHVASEFHPFHKHDVNVLLHLFTTGLGVWGALHLALQYQMESLVYAYAALIFFTTPFVTAVLHTAFVYAACYQLPLPDQGFSFQFNDQTWDLTPLHMCGIAMVAGYGLQDLAHYLCQEATYMGSYIHAKPYMLVIHSVWLMPLVIDAVLMRHCFLPKIVIRNNCLVVKVACTKAVEDMRNWINQNIPSIPETTHVWPHREEGTHQQCLDLENDASIMAGFRKIFPKHHYDVLPVQDMNEIYVTAVGAKKEINSDAVFYTPHTDGPYWFLPGCSLYRVLVGLTPNTMVRTNFNLQHETQNQILDMYGVVGFDYNRELHWIDHVPGAKNTERRSLLKLHYIIYPKGWHAYGKLAATLNTNYNTWARGNFLRTLRPKSLYEYGLAWWIWLTTWFNSIFEEYCGWTNLVYIATAYALGPTPFLILTSFRHYVTYMTTFAFREPMVAHGYLMRDAKLFKTTAIMHLCSRLIPLVQLPDDIGALALVAMGFTVTILATVQLGMVRTYFGSELGFVKPKWISGFPYNTIPHPMIVGQLFAYSNILYWFWDRLSTENVALIGTHMGFYTAHMVQEMLTSSY